MYNMPLMYKKHLYVEQNYKSNAPATKTFSDDIFVELQKQWVEFTLKTLL